MNLRANVLIGQFARRVGAMRVIGASDFGAQG